MRVSKYNKHGMTDRNHWASMMAIKPEVFETANRKLFASRMGSLDLTGGVGVLESLFGINKTEYIDDIKWDWKLDVEASVPIVILDCLTDSPTPGKYRAKFQVLVDKNLAVIGESWSPGSTDKSQVAVVVDIAERGDKYLYTLQTYTEGADHFIRREYLEPGTKWTRMYAMRGEAAESGGHVESSTPVTFQNTLVKLRKEQKVTDYAHDAVLEIGFRDDSGKAYSSWMPMLEKKYEIELNKECMRSAMYSRIGDTPLIDPDSGYPISPGAGLLQQIEFGGNIERYTRLSAELLEAFISRVVGSRISPSDMGEIVGMTGRAGFAQFSAAMNEWAKDQGQIILDSNYVKSDPKGFHKNSLSIGHQFTVWNLPIGGSFRLVYNPLYDDRSINREMDPTTGLPLESSRITILDVTGGKSGLASDNIKIVRKNGVAKRTIVPGRIAPGGTPKYSAHSGDYYRIDYSDSIGIQVTDPTITGELIKTLG